MEHQSSQQEGNNPPINQDAADVLVAVMENQAKEVGLATLDLSTMHLKLMQVVEPSSSYVHVTTLLASIQPSHVLVVDSTQASSTGLNATIQQAYSHIPVPRAYFDDTKAYAQLHEYVCNTADVCQWQQQQVLTSRYLAVGAAGALLRFVTQQYKHTISPKSMHLSIQQPSEYLQLDGITLEGLQVARLHDGAAETQATPMTLYKMLNRCHTKAGARLLKANLLQPPAHLNTIHLRQQALGELLAGDDAAMLCDVRAALSKVPGTVDRLCGLLFCRPASLCGSTANVTAAQLARRATSLLTALLQLKQLLEALTPLVEALEGGSTPLLRAARATCGAAGCGVLLQSILATMEEDAHTAPAAFVNRTQLCFAVRGGVDSLLDVARTTFCETTAAIQEFAHHYQQDTGHLGEIKVKYNARSGFYLQLRKNTPASALPPTMTILDDRPRTTLHCTTPELAALNARLTDAAHDCLLLSVQVLEGQLATVATHARLLMRVVDSVALLDMLCALGLVAQEAATPWVQPRVNEYGPVVIVQGRHPLLETTTTTQCTPNDTYLAPTCAPLHILTGPNMSGKSTYIRLVGTIVLLAHLGAWVPATMCALPLCTRIVLRAGVSPASGMSGGSGFAAEVGQLATMLAGVDARSLVLLDEVGHSTSTQDGVALSWALAEALLDKGVPTLLATHMPELQQLTKVYPTVMHSAFEVRIQDARMAYTWRLRQGTTNNTDVVLHYGLALARALAFPEDVLATATRVVELLHTQEGAVEEQQENGTPAHVAQLAEALQLAHKVECVLESAKPQAAQQLQDDARRVLLNTSQHTPAH